MTIRIERRSITVTPTQARKVVRVTAQVTTDPEETENPTMRQVTALWNTNTPQTALRAALEAAIKDDTLQEALRAEIGEEILPEPPAQEAPQAVTITATNVTINQAGGA